MSLREVELQGAVIVAQQRANRAKAAYEDIKTQYLLVKAVYEHFEREYDTADNAFTAASRALARFREEG